MATLQDLLKRHLEARHMSVKTLAERLGMSYPTVLALIKKGSVPRSQEHRDALRSELELSSDAWAAVFASSMREGVEIPTEGPLTLQQLVIKAMLVQGYSEQSLADKTGLPYPTLLGVTRKGAIPRADTIVTIAESLNIVAQAMDEAVALSKERRGQGDHAGSGIEHTAENSRQGHGGDGDEAEPTDVMVASLAQLALDAVTKAGVSTAYFAKQHDIPYITLMRLIREGVPPVRSAMLQLFQKALGLDDATFEAALDCSRARPEPASRARSNEIASNPLQASLLKVVEERGLTVKAFADLADLSVLTATRLLKKGDLPGRQATHGKLRGLLGLGEADYDLLLQRAHAAGAGRVDDDDDDDDDEAHAPTVAQPATEPFLRQSPVVLSFTGAAKPPQTASIPIGEPTDADFMALIAKLAPKQRRALLGILNSMM